MREMPKKKHHIRLSDQEREELQTILRKGKAKAIRQRHARILLHADTNGANGAMSDSQIAAATQTSIPTVERVRRICVEEGLECALEGRESQRIYLRKLDGNAEARLVALSCGPPPEGRAAWTMSLLADRLVELQIVESIGVETVRTTLKKTKLNRGKKSSG